MRILPSRDAQVGEDKGVSTLPFPLVFQDFLESRDFPGDNKGYCDPCDSTAVLLGPYMMCSTPMQVGAAASLLSGWPTRLYCARQPLAPHLSAVCLQGQ